MQPERSSNTTRPAAWAIWARFFASIAVSILLGLSLLSAIEPNFLPAGAAYATIHSVDDEVVADEQQNSGENGKEDEESGDSESIEDEETPMSSGLGGGEPVSGDMGFAGVAVIGIVAVAAFFFVLMRKLNANIKHMNSMFK